MPSESVAIFTELTQLMNSRYKPGSKETQRIVKKHVELLSEWYEVNKELYLSYAKLYSDSSELRNYFSHYDEKLADFISAAMKHYANKNL